MSKRQKTRSDLGGTHRKGWRWTREQKQKLKRPKSEMHRFRISRAMRGLSTDVNREDLLIEKVEELREELKKFRGE